MSFKIIEWWVVAMISKHTSSIPKQDVVFPRLLHSNSRCSQACRWRSQVLPDLLLVLQDLLSALSDLSSALPGAPKVFCRAPRFSQTYHNDSHHTPVQVIRDFSCSEGQPEYTSRVWYSPEIDAFMFSLHILWDTPGGSQWLKYILLMDDSNTKPKSWNVNMLSYSTQSVIY